MKACPVPPERSEVHRGEAELAQLFDGYERALRFDRQVCLGFSAVCVGRRWGRMCRCCPAAPAALLCRLRSLTKMQHPPLPACPRWLTRC